ncbi:MAG: DMT family transporter [Leptospiraceae bacterium]|nr:DMT family transporter [Leptospiraceae bacterium]
MNFTILLTISMMIWGISWTMGKIVSGYADSFVLLFWRYAITTLCMIPIMFFLKVSWKITRISLLFIITAATINLLYGYFFLQGLKNGLAGAGGVLVTTINPIINFAILSLAGKYHPKKKELLGLLVGFLGGLIIISIWKFSLTEVLSLGNIYFLVASFVWAVNSINSQYAGKVINPILFSFYINSISVPILYLFVYDKNFLAALEFGSEFWICMFYLAALSTALATTIYIIATSKLGSEKASSFVFLVPAFAVLGSFFILGEKPTWNSILGGAIAILAVRMLHTKPHKKVEES